LFLALTLILGSAPERAIHAAGFELLMMNGESVATDATAVVFNPAGLGLLERPQVIVTPTVVTVDFEFESTVGTTLTGNDGGDAGDDFNFTGGAFAALKVTEDLGIGISLTQPFAGNVEYDDGWKGRYNVVKADFEATAVTGAVGYRINDMWAIGAGVWGAYGEFEQTLAVQSPGFADGSARIDTDDWVIGYHAGVLWTPAPTTKVGISYRSEVDFELGGTLSVQLSPGAPGRSISVSSELPAPQRMVGSVFHAVSRQTAVTFDLGWYDFSTFDRTPIDTSGGLSSSIPRNWKDVWRVGLGVQHQLAPQWGLKLGTTFSSSPMNDDDRLPDFPADRQIRASFGLAYIPSKQLQMFAGYEFIDLGDNKIDAVDSGGGRLVGEYDTHFVHVFFVGLSYGF
jgi:long-chain fatty acid transport protein